jgi:hypothetical protein
MAKVRPIPYLKKPEGMSYVSWQHEKWKLCLPHFDDILHLTRAELDELRGTEVSESEYKAEVNLRNIYENMDQNQLEVYAGWEAQAQMEVKRRNGELPR